MGVLRTMVESIHLPFLYHSYGTTIVIGLERLCTGFQSSHFWNASGVDKDQLDLEGSTALLLALHAWQTLTDVVLVVRALYMRRLSQGIGRWWLHYCSFVSSSIQWTTIRPLILLRVWFY